MSAWTDIRQGRRLIDVPPNCPVTPYRPVIDGAGNVATKDWNGHALVVYVAATGTWRTLSDPSFGSWSITFDYAGNVLYLTWKTGEDQPSMWTQPVDGSSAPVEIPWVYNGGGILDYDPMRGVITDTGWPTIVTRPGLPDVMLHHAVYRAGRWLGYANPYPDGTPRQIGLLVVDVLTNTLYRAWTGDPRSLPVRLDDDGKTVAISGPAWGFITEDQWTIEPEAPPAPTPTPVEPMPSLELVLPLKQSARRWVIGLCYGGETEPIGNAAIAFGPDEGPVAPGDLQKIRQGGYRLIVMPIDAVGLHPDNYDFVACYTEGTADVLGRIDSVRAFANAKGKPLYLFGPSFDQAAIVRMERGDICAPYLVPLPGESEANYEARWIALLELYLQELPLDVVFAPIAFLTLRYEAGTGRVVVDEPQLARCTIVLSRVLAKYPDVDLSIFRFGRIDMRPAVRPFIQRLYNDVEAPAVEPGPGPQPEPHPEPPPGPHPDPAPIPEPVPEPEDPPMRVPDSEIAAYTKSVADICGDLFDNVHVFPDTGYTLAQQRASQCIGEWRAYAASAAGGGKEFDGSTVEIRGAMAFYKANGGDDCLGEGKPMRTVYLPYAVRLRR